VRGRVADELRTVQHTAAQFPQRVALRTADGAVSVTWQQYRDRVQAIAAGLAGLGVGAGDTVALVMTNRPEFHVCDTAVLRATPTWVSSRCRSGPVSSCPKVSRSHTEDVLGHLGVNVPDLDAARSYYDELMPLVGFEPFFAADDEFSYKPTGNRSGTYLFFYPAALPGNYSPDRAGLQHMAFILRRRSLIDRVHDHVVGFGGSVIHAPQHFPQYPGHYYATFWSDPFGIKLEAVCHHDREQLWTTVL